jgi:hypothetical protein
MPAASQISIAAIIAGLLDWKTIDDACKIIQRPTLFVKLPLPVLSELDGQMD